MQFSHSLRFLADTIKTLNSKDMEKIHDIQQLLLRTSQLMGELYKLFPNVEELLAISEQFGRIITSLSTKKLFEAKTQFQELFEQITAQEEQEFESFYPKVKKYYQELITKGKSLTEDELLTIEILPNETEIIQDLMIHFLSEGEPVFDEFLPQTSQIRGKSFIQIKNELYSRFLVHTKSDLNVIYSSAFILGGYTFREAHILSDFFEQEKIMVIREWEQLPEISSLFRQANKKKEGVFLFLKWTEGWTEKLINQFPLCEKCLLPYIRDNCIICSKKDNV